MTHQKKSNLCVIILNYFSSDKTIDCIDSILSEPINTLYILENSANINQETSLKEYIRDVNPLIKLKIILLSFDENLGFSKGVNRVIDIDKKSGGHSFYCLLNNDVIATKGFITPLISKLKQNNYTLVSPEVVCNKKHIGYYYYNRYLGAIFLRKLPHTFPFLSGCCLMFSEQIINTRPLFDESFFMYGEDLELCWRAKKNGQAIAVESNSLIYHQGSATSRNGSLFYEYHTMRAHILLAKKMTTGNIQKFNFMLGRSSFLLLRAIYRCYKFKSIVPIKAYFMGFFEMKIRPESTNT